MDPQGSISQWLTPLKDGDPIAIQTIWEQYFQRLVSLARTKLRNSPRRVADEEDVVVTAFDSFCRGAEEGRFPKLHDRSDLWQVLVMLTARKAINQIQHDARRKRGSGAVRGESVFAAGDDFRGIDQVVGAEPSPEFAAQVAEQCRLLLDDLDDAALERIAIARLEGYSNDEIAAQLNVRTRTVERKLRIIREIWSADPNSGPQPPFEDS